jgi:hypothetical protein
MSVPSKTEISLPGARLHNRLDAQPPQNAADLFSHRSEDNGSLFIVSPDAPERTRGQLLNPVRESEFRGLTPARLCP